MPNAAPMIAAAMIRPPAVGENSVSTMPKKMPSHRPESAPAIAARPYVILPVTRSTVFRSLPTIAIFATGKSASASFATTRWASG